MSLRHALNTSGAIRMALLAWGTAEQNWRSSITCGPCIGRVVMGWRLPIEVKDMWGGLDLKPVVIKVRFVLGVLHPKQCLAGNVEYDTFDI